MSLDIYRLRKSIRQVKSSGGREEQLEMVIDLLRLYIGDRSLSRAIKESLHKDSELGQV